MLTTILTALLPVVVVVLLGWLAGKLALLKREDAGVLATYVMSFALPLSLFEGARSTPPSQLLNYGLFATLALAIVGTFVLAAAIGRFVLKHDVKTSAIQGLVCSFPDMAYFAAPVLAALFGAAGFLAILLGNLVVMIVILPATIILTQAADHKEGGHGPMAVVGRSLLGAATNPIVWLPLLGVALSLTGMTLPGPIALSVQTVAKSAGGTSLFALGLMLYGQPINIDRDVVTNVAIKNVVQPLLMIVGALIFALPHAISVQALLTGAAPAATAASMFALKNRVYTAAATSTVLVSTLTSIIIVAVLIAVIG